MCVIAAKPAGVKMPDLDTIKRMWYRNPDGAGIMYANDGKVRIDKGFMKLDELTAHLDKLGKTLDLDALAVVMHFRITTHGGTCPQNCHPFPITRSVKALQTLHQSAPVGVAHNGIIPIQPRHGISDTMEYITTQLAPLYAMAPDFYEDPNALELIRNAIKSKMAILTGDGKIALVGDFTNRDGIQYSNTYHEPAAFTHLLENVGGWKTVTPKAAAKATTKEPKRLKEIPLMFAEFLPPGAFVRYGVSGEVSDDLADLLLDEQGRTYTHACEDDLCYPDPNVYVYDHNGSPAKFNPDEASLERVAYTYADMYARKAKKQAKKK